MPKKKLIGELEIFHNFINLKNVDKVAQALDLSPQVVAEKLANLEKKTKSSLFNQNGNLTKEGREFHEFIKPLICEFDQILEKFLLQKNQKNQIKIAVHHIAISYLMPKIILYFKTIHPDIKIIIQNISPSLALQRLKSKEIATEIDLAFFPNFEKDPEIKLTEIISYDPILIMNKNHSLAQKKIDNLSDLEKYNLIRINSDLVNLPLFENAIKTYNLSGSLELENGNCEMLKHFVKQNDFIALISTICINKNDDDLVIKNLSQFFPKITYAIATKKSKMLDSTVKDLIKIFSEATKNV